MRLVTKINLALLGVVAVSAGLNFAALRMAVMPSFAALEAQAADQNQSRVIEAIELQKEQVANSAGDYAIWDDTYEFMSGRSDEYEEKNVTAESLKTLGVNYFVALDNDGKIILDKGFRYEGEAPKPLKLFQTGATPSVNALVAKHDEIKIQSGLMRTEEGVIVVGYAPILRSDRSGERVGILLLGRILDSSAIKAATKVDFDLLQPGSITRTARSSDAASLNRVDQLAGLDGAPVAMLVSTTLRDISAVGQRTILTTMLFLLAGSALLLLALGFVIRKIAVSRIERLRSHLNAVASSGNLATLPEDGRGDELSETLQSFNGMARQLAELRDKLRRQDYDHGAADQAADLLHNVRNAMSPVSALAWHLSRQNETTSRQNLAKAIDQLKNPDLAPERATKLNQFVAMSAARLLEDDAKNQKDLHSMVTMLRHIEDILRESDASAQLERVAEKIDLKQTIVDAVRVVEHRGTVVVKLDGMHGAAVMGHKIPLDQVIANILINAAEAIELSPKKMGHIEVATEQAVSDQGNAQVVLHIRDSGIGIERVHLDRVFEKGFSTKRDGKRGLGLHYCANAINAMGGKIMVESAGIEQGTTVSIILPALQINKAAA
ncbi:HAMP domain-containing protein [Rhizobium sp. XQZ8]|uniref:sensor histidine kinase n=1 Tax=Rhizobium populisoli TaxID=2859785 RepID=UPI001CA48A47|nr:CHASE4 domain-containing protein [Rhizobium populisoli]MBW6425195.1 HAMP domain-containing protein [Rhizobium populisoli]